MLSRDPKGNENQQQRKKGTHILVAHIFRVTFVGCVFLVQVLRPELSNENCENRALYLNV